MAEPVMEPQPGSGADPNAQLVPSPSNDEGKVQGGRTIENLYAEFSRKNKDLTTRISELTELVRQTVPKQAEAPAVPAPVYQPQVTQPNPVRSPYGAPRALDQFDDNALQDALRNPAVPEYQKGLIRQEVDMRSQERQIETMFQQRERQQHVNSIKLESERAAQSAYPALRDSESEFSRRVDAELQKQRKLLGEFPSDKLDVANRVAQSMGVSAQRGVQFGFVAGTESRQVEEPAEYVPQGMSDELYNELAARFADTLPSDVGPDGRSKRRKFDKKRILESSKIYEEADQAGAVRGRGRRVKGRTA